MAQTTKGKSKLREPPPSLFLHPSHSASHVSLPGILAPGGRPGTSTGGQNAQVGSALERTSSLHSVSIVAPIPTRTGRNLKTADSSRSNDRTDALWAEMQATLEEVQLSASGGTRVFGPEHDRKLADLRASQIALAQAWARSEADGETETAQRGNTTPPTADESRSNRNASSEAPRPGSDIPEGAKTIGGGTSSPRPGSSGLDTERLGAKLEEDTEADILGARQRREANDRYFQRVNQGVLDVVAKLNDVATAMKAVEQESRSIWGESDIAPEDAKAQS